jgi:hypothetical protein
MVSLQLSDSGDLIITPSTGSAKKDFDFLIGKWLVKNRKLKSRLNDCNDWLSFDATNYDHSIYPDWET